MSSAAYYSCRHAVRRHHKDSLPFPFPSLSLSPQTPCCLHCTGPHPWSCQPVFPVSMQSPSLSGSVVWNTGFWRSRRGRKEKKKGRWWWIKEVVKELGHFLLTLSLCYMPRAISEWNYQLQAKALEIPSGPKTQETKTKVKPWPL